MVQKAKDEDVNVETDLIKQASTSTAARTTLPPSKTFRKMPNSRE